MKDTKANPVIAEAKKTIPGRWTKTKKWVKKHQKKIYLTMGGVALLGMTYYFLRKRDDQRTREHFHSILVFKDQFAQAEAENQARAEQKFDYMVKQTKFLNFIIEKLYKDPDFHEFLKQKRITGFKPLK